MSVLQMSFNLWVLCCGLFFQRNTKQLVASESLPINQLSHFRIDLEFTITHWRARTYCIRWISDFFLVYFLIIEMKMAFLCFFFHFVPFVTAHIYLTDNYIHLFIHLISFPMKHFDVEYSSNSSLSPPPPPPSTRIYIAWYRNREWKIIKQEGRTDCEIHIISSSYYGDLQHSIAFTQNHDVMDDELTRTTEIAVINWK